MNKKNKLASLEKQTFSVSKEMIRDIKFMLACLNIKFIEAPAGFEGEAIASYLTKIGQADAVFSGDTDPIAYGAKTLLRRNPKDKLIYEYTQQDILKQISEANDEYPEPTLSDLHKIAMALGTDACDKTPGIGPATVLKKLHEITLTPTQISAIKEFTKEPELSEVVTYNADKEAFKDFKQEELLNWLVTEKSFSRTLVTAQLQKATNPVEPSKTQTKKSSAKKAPAKKAPAKKAPASPKSPRSPKKPIKRGTPANIKK
jgi:5'-3' exonuclease